MLDGYASFAAPAEVAQLIFDLRTQLDALLRRKIDSCRTRPTARRVGAVAAFPLPDTFTALMM
jgi:hypothetical protein